MAARMSQIVLLRVARYLPIGAEHAIPGEGCGQMSGKPQGRKARGRTGASAIAMGYGVLNGGTGLSKLDRGTDARATAPWGVKAMWSEPDIGEARVQERWI